MIPFHPSWLTVVSALGGIDEVFLHRQLEPVAYFEDLSYPAPLYLPLPRCLLMAAINTTHF